MRYRIIAALLVIVFVFPIGSLAVQVETDSIVSYGLLSEGQPIDSLTNIKVVKGYVEINQEAPMDNALLLVSKYKDGRLIDLEALNLVGKSGWVETPVIEVTETGTVIKVMVVEGYETMRPLVEVKKFTKSLILQNNQIKAINEEGGVITLTYQQDTALQSITFPSDTTCYYNEVRSEMAGKWTEAVGINRFYGFLELVQDTTGAYTDVYITDYELFVVDKVNPQTKTITDVNSGTVLTYGNEEGTINAKLLDFWEDEEQDWEVHLPGYDVLIYTYAEAPDGQAVLKAWNIVPRGVGRIEQVLNPGTEDVLYQLDGRQYPVSEKMPFPELQAGDAGHFYPDRLGNIIYYEKYNPAEDYGYIVDASVDEVSGRVQFRFVKQVAGASPTMVNSAERLNIDGKFMYDAHAIVDYLTMVCSKYSGYTEQPGARINVDGNGGAVTQLVKYRLNTAGEIISIDTVERGSQNQDGKAFAVYSRNSSRDWVSSTSGYEFTDSNDSPKIRVARYTYILFVPEDRTDYGEYCVKRFTFNLFESGRKYNLEAYDVHEPSGIAKAIVVYGGSADQYIYKETPVALITDIRTVDRGKGPVMEVTAYVVGVGENGNEVKKLYTEDMNTEGIEIGNVIRFGKTNRGEIKTGSVQILVDVETGTIDPFTTDENNNPLKIPSFIDHSKETYNNGYYYRVAHGLLNYAVDDEPFSFSSIIPVGTRTREAVEAAKNQQYDFITDSTTSFYTYDASLPYSNRVYKHDYLTLFTYPSYTMKGQESTEESAQRAQELFVYEANDRVRMVYIIKR